MNKAVVVFMTDKAHVHQLNREALVQVSALLVPFMRLTMSGVSPFLPNESLESENELCGLSRFFSSFRPVSLGCKDPKLKHVQSLRWQAFMCLDSPAQTLDSSFRVK